MEFVEYKSDGKAGTLTSNGKFLVFDYESNSKRRKLRKSTIEEVETISRNPLRYIIYSSLSFLGAWIVNSGSTLPEEVSLVAFSLLLIVGGYNGLLFYYHNKYSHVVKLKTVSGSTVKLLTNGPDDQLFE